MNCTCSLTSEKILEVVVVHIDRLREGERLGQRLTFLVRKIEREVAYVELSFEGLVAVPPQVSNFATVETFVVALESVDVHRDASAAVHDSSAGRPVAGIGRGGERSKSGCRFHRGT